MCSAVSPMLQPPTHGVNHPDLMPAHGLLQGGAAEAVAAQLEARLRAALKSRANPFSEAAPALAGQLGRPLLALFDRSFELRWCRGNVFHWCSAKPALSELAAPGRLARQGGMLCGG